jgi:hypothetical protein
MENGDLAPGSILGPHPWGARAKPGDPLCLVTNHREIVQLPTLRHRSANEKLFGPHDPGNFRRERQQSLRKPESSPSEVTLP